MHPSPFSTRWPPHGASASLSQLVPRWSHYCLLNSGFLCGTSRTYINVLGEAMLTILICYLYSRSGPRSNISPLGKPPREMLCSSFKCKNLSNILKSWTPTSGLILPKGTLIFLWSPSVVTITAHYVVKERPGCGNSFQPKADGVVANRLFKGGDNPAFHRIAGFILSPFLKHWLCRGHTPPPYSCSSLKSSSTFWFSV